ncbi:AraC family transcriptional regulator [Pseudomonas fluorescens]|uniref:AraC family transcriptional regulator n=1 Tax=Pseudomonas fluorescens TaxID=294 RepID=UPI003C154A24
MPSKKSSLRMGGPGEISTSPFRSFPEVVDAIGGSSRSVFKNAGISLEQFAYEDNHLAYMDVARLFNTAFEHTQCPHIGLLIGERFSLDKLGPVGQLMRLANTPGDALNDLVGHANLYDRGATPLLLPLAGQHSLLGYVIYRHDLPNQSLLVDTAVMVGLQMLRALLGANWTPVRVQFSYRKPSDITPYVRKFRCNIQFNASISGLVINNQQLRQIQCTANPRLHHLLKLAISTATSPLTISEQIKSQTYALLLKGQANSKHIASQFSLNERTLRRRLDAEGSHLKELITDSRSNFARQLLKDTDLPISTISQALQYQDPNAFSRAFKTWTNTSPQHWRNGLG